MSASSDNANSFTGRRNFLKTFFGVQCLIQKSNAEAKSSGGNCNFYWLDLRTGQIAFPTGLTVRQGKPGSLMKVIALAAMKEENILPADKTFECRGSIIADGEKYSCLEPHGRIDLVRALGLSCNVAFVQASSHLSPEMFLEYARRFGLNKPVAKYASGLFPSHAEEPARHYVLGTSDKFQPQPLQIMRMCALIAGKGILPYLHDASDTTASGRPFRIVLRDTTWTALEQGMQMAGRLGTAKKLDPTNKLHLAVKTGTAMHGTTFQSWVAGYFPYEEPRYAFCLRAYSGTSQQAAVPLAAKYLLSTEWP